MRYGIFSDVHGNLEAFRALCSYYKKEQIDKFIFIGDIIGYGADPKKCISILRNLRPMSIAGNHDWATIDKISLNYFNLYAKNALLWTIQQLDNSDREYLAAFDLVYQEPDLICAHGSLIKPANFSYILDVNDARNNFSVLDRQLCFIGHSHKAGIYSAKGNHISWVYEDRVNLKKELRYIINVGSVGQPRDGNPGASACIYDNSEDVVRFIRVKYDIDKAAKKILANRLPSQLAARLYVGH